jgi:hypothetical protein
VGVCFYFYKKSKKIVQLNTDTINRNKEISNLNVTLRNEINKLENTKSFLEEQNNFIERTVNKKKSSMTALANEAFMNYCETLDAQYQAKEKEYDNLIETLKTVYDNKRDQLERECVEVKAELLKLRNSRAATMEALIREQEIKEKKNFYCLTPTLAEITDIQTLEEVKKKLFNPRVLSMLIWTTFFQKDMTALCNRVVGTDKKCGIYKITNQLDDMCYIGQSVDIANRWKDHAKHGLGIDAPASNKLYNAMQKWGIWNFSWELLEECPREQLNEKERYYIDLYQSEKFGYNSTKGNK